MATIVASDVERFLFRPGLAPRARYYAVIFLNQLQLSHDPARGAAPCCVPHAGQPCEQRIMCDAF